MIKISGLKFQYPNDLSNQGDPVNVFQLAIESLSIEANEKLAIVGPSGSGKTTLLNLLSGIYVPQSGSIEIAQTNVSQLSDAQRRAFRINQIGFIFQDFSLIDYLSVRDNIIHPYRISKSLKLSKVVIERISELTQLMGIADKLKRFPHQLSQGEKQRVAICRALLPAPALLLADEATGNLDPENKQKILELIFKSAETYNATLITVTHDHELLPHFDRVIDFKTFLPSASVDTKGSLHAQ
ncbi:MAG: ATP-binding cassette domain-containing protein [Gammaproteobacteria bacterium]|nr:ATP-binding cassette domain-containing protein [Gammaproteobacteria bacterium]